jgi:hypothetical protein
MWVEYDVQVLGEPVTVEVLVGESVRETPDVCHRWIEVRVVNHPPSGIRQTAKLLVDENAYPDKFEVVRGWIQHEGDLCEFTSVGDDATATMTDHLRRLGHPRAAVLEVPLSVFDALELLFNAQLEAAKPEFRQLRRELSASFNYADSAGKMSFEKRDLLGHSNKILVETWRSPLEEKGKAAVIERSRDLPLAFHSVSVTSGNHVSFRARVRDYGDGRHVDVAGEIESLEREAKKTQDRIPTKLKNFRSWTKPDGGCFWAEYGGNIWTDGREMAIFYDEEGVRLDDVPYAILAEIDRKHICRGRVFRSHCGSWIQAWVEDCTGHDPVTLRLRVTDAGSSDYKEGDLVGPFPATQLAPDDQDWIRQYVDTDCHWGRE